MYELFKECVYILQNYIGGGYMFFLYLAALIYLLITEKEKHIRVLVLYVPLLILVVYMLPFFRLFYVSALDDSETYYRILWLLPVGVTIAYGGCRLFEKHRRIGLIAVSALICVAGTYVYNSPHISKAENRYHLPQVTINTVDFILQDAEYYYIHAVFPREHVHFVRQYDSRIRLAYGRNILVDRWEMKSPVFEAMEGQEVIDIPALLAATRALEVNYIVIHSMRPLSHNPNDFDVYIIANIDGMAVYRDEVMVGHIRDKYGEYWEKIDK
jgi:hypothetical protein